VKHPLESPLKAGEGRHTESLRRRCGGPERHRIFALSTGPAAGQTPASRKSLGLARVGGRSGVKKGIFGWMVLDNLDNFGE